MPEIAIYRDSKGKGRCRSCGAPIEWAETIQGKRMPFDGEIVASRAQGNPITGRVIEYVDTSVSATHFQTCPQAPDWRPSPVSKGLGVEMNLPIELHIHIHHESCARDAEKLDLILTQLAGLIAQGAREMQELETLKTKVQETTTVEQSAIELLNGLGAQIAALKEDPVALQALSDQLAAKSSDLAARHLGQHAGGVVRRFGGRGFESRQRRINRVIPVPCCSSVWIERRKPESTRVSGL